MTATDYQPSRSLPSNPAELVALAHDYDAAIRMLVSRVLADGPRVDDVMQEVYVRIFRGSASFRGDASLRTWVYRIAHNLCVDELRRVRALVREVEMEQADELRCARPDPSDRVALRTDLATALATLTPPLREAVILVDCLGLDYAEASERLGVAVGTVASRLSRARVALRRALALDVTAYPAAA
jgi:RNA polymerase sigma-70 factor, ECF subfamily